jgi:hypothetical protein
MGVSAFSFEKLKEDGKNQQIVMGLLREIKVNPHETGFILSDIERGKKYRRFFYFSFCLVHRLTYNRPC